MLALRTIILYKYRKFFILYQKDFPKIKEWKAGKCVRENHRLIQTIIQILAMVPWQEERALFCISHSRVSCGHTHTTHVCMCVCICALYLWFFTLVGFPFWLGGLVVALGWFSLSTTRSDPFLSSVSFHFISPFFCVSFFLIVRKETKILFLTTIGSLTH